MGASAGSTVGRRRSSVSMSEIRSRTARQRSGPWAMKALRAGAVNTEVGKHGGHVEHLVPDGTPTLGRPSGGVNTP